MEEIVQRAVAMLCDDYERRDGQLSRSQVERLIEKRKLTVEESASVYDELAKRGITPEDDVDEEDSAGLDTSAILGAGEGGDYEPDFSVEHLLKRTQNSALLTAEEERTLGRRIALAQRARDELATGAAASRVFLETLKRGDDARRRMILSNLRLVVHNARHFVGLSSLTLDDLVQEGTIGLMKAVDKYDPGLGYRFSTYATWWIWQAITRALADKGATIRLPVHVNTDMLRFRRAYNLLLQAHPDKRPTISQVADELVWTVDKAHFIQQLVSLVPVSLYNETPGYEHLTLIDILAADGDRPDECFERLDLSRAIDRAFDSLKEREKEILIMRFGLSGDGTGKTLEEIGQHFGVTRERIRQIEAKALGKLRKSGRSPLRDFSNSIHPPPDRNSRNEEGHV